MRRSASKTRAWRTPFGVDPDAQKKVEKAPRPVSGLASGGWSPPSARLPVNVNSQWPGVHPLAYRCGGSPGFAPPRGFPGGGNAPDSRFTRDAWKRRGHLAADYGPII